MEVIGITLALGAVMALSGLGVLALTFLVCLVTAKLWPSLLPYLPIGLTMIATSVITQLF